MIVIDNREPKEYQELGDSVARLNCDAAVIVGDEIVRVERKTPTDLIESIEMGRLNDQLANVTELVIVDDNSQWLPKGVFDTLYHDDKLRNVVNGISEHHVVKYANSPQDYIRILRRIEDKMKDGTYATIRVHARIDYSYDTPEIAFIASIPGIGEELAKRIIEHYHSPVEAIINIHKWNETIRGVGKRKVNDVLRFMLGKRKSPEDDTDVCE